MFGLSVRGVDLIGATNVTKLLLTAFNFERLPRRSVNAGFRGMVYGQASLGEWLDEPKPEIRKSSAISVT
jgi:hypothetical protein